MMRFWNVELSPTYSNDLFRSMKVFSMSATVNTGVLYVFPYVWGVLLSGYSVAN